jgi:hypothetical protein
MLDIAAAFKVTSETRRASFDDIAVLIKGISAPTSLRFGLNPRHKSGKEDISLDTLRRPKLCQAVMAIAKAVLGEHFEKNAITYAKLEVDPQRGEESVKSTTHGAFVITFRKPAPGAISQSSVLFELRDIGLALRASAVPTVSPATSSVAKIAAGAAYGHAECWDANGEIVKEDMARIILQLHSPRVDISTATREFLVFHGFPIPSPFPALEVANKAGSASQLIQTAKALYKRESIVWRPGYAQRMAEVTAKRAARSVSRTFCPHCECNSCKAKKAKKDVA